jgi:hypothetical protein
LRTNSLAGEFLLSELTACGAERAAKRAIGGKAVNRIRKRLDVIPRHQQRVEIGMRDCTAAWDIRGDERAPARSGLDEAQRQSFAM